MDYTQQVEAVSRAVAKDVVTLTNGKPARAIILRETFPAPVQTVWDAVTQPESLATWFAPVSGDLRMNGHYSIMGNARGTVTECRPPEGFALSWELGEVISAVRVNLRAADDDAVTELELRHTFPVDAHWREYGPGAGGVGWDMTLIGLTLFLAGRPKPSEEDWAASREAAEFAERASERWRDAAIEGGEDEAWARKAGDKTTAFYVPGWKAYASSDGK
ncbi:START-like domain protein [Cordyceps fumosorosea ARSEF 2679]|uniref:START-like domain protein n=1 Tax=Cordyceps fumosorosea (strain ARSEF 2679) TaxID=1081104 RepID=A0A168E561_CORFA|nr:START-like domain protein [Cordyceps fumosorosea ARSEF 2679]OAA73388.1 START-like domain protein [Cordyceps fumosorosea ARSEF 2679]